MNLWMLEDTASGKKITVRAWSARHAKYLGVNHPKTPIAATKITMLGRANPNNEDGWKARTASALPHHGVMPHGD